MKYEKQRQVIDNKENYPEFFKKHVKIAKVSRCQMCGEKLTGHVSEVAHILPKSRFKSVSVEDGNIVYLCGMWSDNQCHNKYDNGGKVPKEFIDLIQSKVEKFFHKIQEKLTIKDEDKYVRRSEETQ